MTITDPALVAAATLADRYISDRFLPDKAIDLIDEAGARMGIRRMTAPPDLREFDEKIAAVRRDKESAVDAQDFERAAHLRDSEKQRVLLDLPGATADVPGPTPGRIGWRMVGMVRPGPSHGPALLAVGHLAVVGWSGRVAGSGAPSPVRGAPVSGGRVPSTGCGRGGRVGCAGPGLVAEQGPPVAAPVDRPEVTTAGGGEPAMNPGRPVPVRSP